MTTRNLAAAIAQHLGTEWKIEDDDPATADTWAAIHDNAGRRITMRRDGQRLNLHGVSPVGVRMRSHHTISVGITRPPRLIADHITRRLMPDYDEALAAALAEKAKDDAAAEAQDKAVRRLSAILPKCSIDGDGRLSWFMTDHGRGYGDVRLNHDGSGASEIDIRSLPIEMVEKILAVLAS